VRLRENIWQENAVIPQVAAPGAESAVYDFLVHWIILKGPRRPIRISSVSLHTDAYCRSWGKGKERNPENVGMF